MLFNITHLQQIAKDIQSKKRIKAINIENVSILFRWVESAVQHQKYSYSPFLVI